jgi:hypothetical protein
MNSKTESKHHGTSAPWPHFAPDEVEAATSVLRSGRVNYWTGEEGRLFEKEFAELDCPWHDRGSQPCGDRLSGGRAPHRHALGHWPSKAAGH